MSLASNRREVIGALVTMLAVELPDVSVHPWFPGQTLEDRVLWVGEPVGDVEVPVMAGPGRLDRNDEFRATVYTHAHLPGATASAVEAAVTAQVNAVEAVLVAAKAGAGWPASVMWAVPASMEGPGLEPHPNGEGWIGYAAVTIEVTCRLW